LYNVAVPVTMVNLAIFQTGNAAVGPLLGIGSMLIVVAGACFAWTVLSNLRSQ
jgi:hypothetical protein